MKNKKTKNKFFGKENINDYILNNKITLMQYALVFIIPTTLVLIIFKLLAIAPFGENSLLTMDLWGQYFPMYLQQYSNNSLSDFMYSFNGALGFNSYVQSAYYTNSIFWIIFKFFKPEQMIAVLDVICALKFGFSAMTCLGYLRKKFKSSNFFLLAGAISYALCSYALAFISQCMWTDSIILLPLILIGLEKLINEKKPGMYTLVLAFTIITNFYIGFTCCIFVSLYFIVQMILKLNLKFNASKLQVTNIKEIGKNVLRFCIFSLLAGGLAAVVIIPILKAINLTIASDSQFPDILTWYHSFAEYINSMMPETKLSYEFGVPNIATGLIYFLLIPLFFFNKKIAIKEKIVYGVFLLVLYFSLNINMLDYIWHGFHFPNQLPGRWSFMFSLLVVLMGCKSLVEYKGISYKSILSSWITGAFFIYFSKYGMDLVTEEYEKVVKNSIIFITFICIILFVLAINEKKLKDKIIKQGMIFVLTLSCIINVSLNTGRIYKREIKMSSGALYNEMMKPVRESGQKVDSGKPDFYRVGTNGNFTFNTGLVGDYKDLSYYSSTMNAKTYNLLLSMGNRVYAKNVSSVYNPGSPVMNSIFAVGKIIDRNKDLVLPESQLIESEEKYNIYENLTSLGLIYPVSNEITGWTVSDQPKGIENQNILLNYMVGEDLNVFEIMQQPTPYLENVSIDQNEDWNNNYYHKTESIAKINYTYVCQMDGPVYIENNYRIGTMKTISSNGTNVTINPNNERFKCLGYYKAGDTITVYIEIAESSLGLAGVNLYRFNETKWQQAYEMLKGNFEVESFKSTKIKGKMTMANDGVVFSSVIQDGGWSVYCDGDKIKPMLIGDSFIGFYLPAGEHTIEYKYNVPGLALGAILSIICLSLFVLITNKKNKYIF